MLYLLDSPATTKDVLCSAWALISLRLVRAKPEVPSQSPPVSLSLFTLALQRDSPWIQRKITKQWILSGFKNMHFFHN